MSCKEQQLQQAQWSSYPGPAGGKWPVLTSIWPRGPGGWDKVASQG